MSLKSLFRTAFEKGPWQQPEPMSASGLDSTNFEFMLTSLIPGSDLRQLSVSRDTMVSLSLPRPAHSGH